jgi:hypothetical protein
MLARLVGARGDSHSATREVSGWQGAKVAEFASRFFGRLLQPCDVPHLASYEMIRCEFEKKAYAV